MPQFTIDLPQKAVDKLKAHVQRTNDNQGTALTLKDWIVLHLNEIAVSEDLTAAIDQLRRQAEADANTAFDAAVKTTRDELLAEL